MNNLKIITVCGAGVGTSTLLRMNINKAVESFKLPIDVSVENKGLSTAKGLHCDAIFTFPSFYDDLKNSYEDIYVINNLMDMDELKAKVKELLIKKGLITEG